jgi:hypothetical protein
MSDALRNLAASILDHPWLVLIFVAIGFVRWLTEKAKGSKDIPQPPEPAPVEPIQRSNPQSEEERIRRFLEALGQPRGAQPPAPVAPRSTVRRVVTPAPPPFGSPLPPLKTVPPPLPSASEPPPMPAQLPPPPQLLRPLPISESTFEIRAVGETDDRSRRSTKVTQAEPSTLGGRLKTAQTVRDAIVLREIFGPPRSLQPVDLTNF